MKLYYCKVCNEFAVEKKLIAHKTQHTVFENGHLKDPVFEIDHDLAIVMQNLARKNYKVIGYGMANADTKFNYAYMEFIIPYYGIQLAAESAGLQIFLYDNFIYKDQETGEYVNGKLSKTEEILPFVPGMAPKSDKDKLEDFGLIKTTSMVVYFYDEKIQPDEPNIEALKRYHELLTKFILLAENACG